MVLKFLTSIPELPKLDLGAPDTRQHRLEEWRHAVVMLLQPTIPMVMEWWTWTWSSADSCYLQWLRLPALEKHQKRVEAAVPRRLLFVDDWFLPRVLAVLPWRLEEQAADERKLGRSYKVADVLFTLMVAMKPAMLDE